MLVVRKQRPIKRMVASQFEAKDLVQQFRQSPAVVRLTRLESQVNLAAWFQTGRGNFENVLQKYLIGKDVSWVAVGHTPVCGQVNMIMSNRPIW